MKNLKKYSVILVAGLFIGAGTIKGLSGIVSVSSNVNGRELPIYSVETDKKQVALSFDAAWNNVKLRIK